MPTKKKASPPASPFTWHASTPNRHVGRLPSDLAGLGLSVEVVRSPSWKRRIVIEPWHIVLFGKVHCGMPRFSDLEAAKAAAEAEALKQLASAVAQIGAALPRAGHDRKVPGKKSLGASQHVHAGLHAWRRGREHEESRIGSAWEVHERTSPVLARECFARGSSDHRRRLEERPCQAVLGRKENDIMSAIPYAPSFEDVFWEAVVKSGGENALALLLKAPAIAGPWYTREDDKHFRQRDAYDLHRGTDHSERVSRTFAAAWVKDLGNGQWSWSVGYTTSQAEAERLCDEALRAAGWVLL